MKKIALLRRYKRSNQLKTTFLASLMLLMAITAKAELPNLFTPLNITVANLNTEQRAIYEKAVAFGIYNTFQFVHIAPIATAQQNGVISVSVEHAECPAYHFDNKNVAYKSAEEYYWYGELVYDDSSSDCSKGSLMMLSNSAGQQYGHLELENKTFEVIDLTGGIQLVAQVDYNKTKDHGCGTLAPHNTGAKSTGIVSHASAGLACSQRVLIVFTPYAALTDPMGFNRGLLTFAQAKQAMLNSGVSAYRINLMLSIAYVPYIERPYHYDIVNPTGGISEDLNNMYNDATLAPQITALKAQYKADIVMLFVMNSSTGDNAAGIANQTEAPTYNYQYGVVQTGYATAAGYSFAHELGHLIGAKHSDDGVLDADMSAGISHAHKWGWTTYTGYSFWRKGHEQSAKSITYQSTAGDNSVMLTYSTPLVSNDGAAHGITSDRDAAQEFRNVGCLVSDFNPAPDEFTVTIGPDAPVNSAGRYIYCRKVENHELTAYVTGPTGVYQYLWEFSSNGMSNWQNGGTGPLFPLSIYYNGIMYVRLTVTPPAGVGSPITVYYVLETTNDCIAGEAFKSAPCGIHAPVSKTQLLKISPNPAPADITVQYELEQGSDVSIALYDVQGRLVKTVNQSDVAAGAHNAMLNTGNIESGTYILRFIVGSYSESKKITIQH